MFGADVAIGKSLLDALKHLPEEQKKAEQIWGRALKGEGYEAVEEFGDPRRMRRVFDIRFIPILDSANRVRGAAHIVRDITDRIHAEAGMKQALQDLARSNSDLEQFAYVASHDLQEPLRTVTSFLSLLSDRYRGKLGEDADTYIAFAMEGAARMREQIKGLLQYARAGQSIENPSSDANDVLKQVIEASATQIEEVGARIEFENLPTVRIDPVQLSQIFQNLIGNALKFRDPTRKPHIIVSARKASETADALQLPPDSYVFSVSDNGIGIDPEAHDRIFMIFQRLHTTGEYAGTGMGLAICKKIIERNGGRIWVKAIPGKGSVFMFVLKAA